jgi:hypothetical protein
MMLSLMVVNVEDYRQYSHPDIIVERGLVEAGFHTAEKVYTSSALYPSGAILACVINVQSPSRIHHLKI